MFKLIQSIHTFYICFLACSENVNVAPNIFWRKCLCSVSLINSFSVVKCSLGVIFSIPKFMEMIVGCHLSPYSKLAQTAKSLEVVLQESL